MAKAAPGIFDSSAVRAIVVPNGEDIFDDITPQRAAPPTVRPVVLRV